jgi:hypothetical protein
MGKRVVMLVLQNMGKSKYFKKMYFMSIYSNKNVLYVHILNTNCFKTDKTKQTRRDGAAQHKFVFGWKIWLLNLFFKWKSLHLKQD